MRGSDGEGEEEGGGKGQLNRPSSSSVFVADSD